MVLYCIMLCVSKCLDCVCCRIPCSSNAYGLCSIVTIRSICKFKSILSALIHFMKSNFQCLELNAQKEQKTIFDVFHYSTEVVHLIFVKNIIFQIRIE